MRLSTRSLVSSVVALVVAPVIGFAAMAPANAAPGGNKPPKNVATCESASVDTTLASASVGRKGLSQTSGASAVVITLSGGDVSFAPQQDYTLTGVVLGGAYTAVSPAKVAGETASYPSPWSHGKNVGVSACGYYTAPTPPPPSTTGSLTFSCYAVTSYVDRNYEYAWNYVGGSVSHVFAVTYSDVETGLTETIPTTAEANTTGGGFFEQANVGDHVTISVTLDGADLPTFAYSGVAGTDPCDATTPLS